MPNRCLVNLETAAAAFLRRARRSFFVVGVVTVGFASTGCYENFSDPAAIVGFDFYDYIRPRAVATTTGGDIYVTLTNNFPTYVVTQVWVSEDGGETFSRSATASPDSLAATVAIADHEEDAYYYMHCWDLVLGPRIYINSIGLGQADTRWDVDHFYYDLGLAQSTVTDHLVAAYGDESTIYAVSSSDRALSWSSPDVVTTAASGALGLLDLEYNSAGDAVMFYSFQSPGDYPNYRVRHSSNDGVDWDPYVAVNSTVSGDISQGGDLVVTAADVLHAVWATDANYKYATSTDLGRTWEDNTIIAWDSVQNISLILAGGSQLMVSYLSDDQNIRYRTYDGTTWSDERRMNNVYGAALEYGGMSQDPNTGALAAVWSEEVDGERIGHASTSDPERSDDYGVQFVDATVISSAARGENIEFQYTVGNYTDDPTSVDVWLRYEGENGMKGYLTKHSGVSLDSEEETTLTYTGRVPLGCPLQSFDLTIMVGSSLPGGRTDTDTFAARVTRVAD